MDDYGEFVGFGSVLCGGKLTQMAQMFDRFEWIYMNFGKFG